MTHAIMSNTDYKGICDTVREKTETSALLKSAEVAPAIRSIELGGTSLMLTVTTEAGATVTATKGSLSVTAVATNGTATLKLKEAGEWTVTATLNGQSNVVVVSVTDRYELSLKYASTASYTGTYTDEVVDMTDGKYYLLTLTGSGTLTFSAPTECDIWMCGGGGAGGSVRSAAVGCGGGGGGYVANVFGAKIKQITIENGAGGESVANATGAAGGSTIITGDISLSANGGDGGHKNASGGVAGANGGSGGGSGWTGPNGGGAGTGAGETTVPFAGKYGEPLAAGGGGGVAISSGQRGGGAGGTNGGNGGSFVTASSSVPGGAGGNLGGGNGGKVNAAGSDATAFGGGGGGAGGNMSTLPGGAGYQGCVMVRVPYAGQQLTVITFTIAGVEYRTKRGWTWYAWVKSDYNTSGFLCHGTNAMPILTSDGEQTVVGVVSNDVIQEGYAYSLRKAN